MNKETASRLTALFNGESSGVLLDFDKFLLQYTTPMGDDITVNVGTPERLSQYLNRIFNSKDLLFGTYEMFRNAAPVTFKGMGWKPGSKDPACLFEFRFFSGLHMPSNVHFSENIKTIGHRTEVTGFHEGPSAHDFLAVMESAGKDWSAVSFHQTRKRPALRIVQG